ncbi:uncharacterized protein TM35_000232420, partial [Trypanosoma theileri]
ATEVVEEVRAVSIDLVPLRASEMMLPVLVAFEEKLPVLRATDVFEEVRRVVKKLDVDSLNAVGNEVGVDVVAEPMNVCMLYRVGFVGAGWKRLVDHNRHRLNECFLADAAVRADVVPKSIENVTCSDSGDVVVTAWIEHPRRLAQSDVCRFLHEAPFSSMWELYDTVSGRASVTGGAAMATTFHRVGFEGIDRPLGGRGEAIRTAFVLDVAEVLSLPNAAVRIAGHEEAANGGRLVFDVLLDHPSTLAETEIDRVLAEAPFTRVWDVYRNTKTPVMHKLPPLRTPPRSVSPRALSPRSLSRPQLSPAHYRQHQEQQPHCCPHHLFQDSGDSPRGTQHHYLQPTCSYLNYMLARGGDPRTAQRPRRLPRPYRVSPLRNSPRNSPRSSEVHSGAVSALVHIPSAGREMSQENPVMLPPLRFTPRTQELTPRTDSLHPRAQPMAPRQQQQQHLIDLRGVGNALLQRRLRKKEHNVS